MNWNLQRNTSKYHGNVCYVTIDTCIKWILVQKQWTDLTMVLKIVYFLSVYRKDFQSNLMKLYQGTEHLKYRFDEYGLGTEWFLFIPVRDI